MSHPHGTDLSIMANALLDPSAPVPPGLTAPSGASAAARWAVHRNNVVHSLTSVLADTFHVVRELVGDVFFNAMARCFVSECPPTTPLMHRYGEAFPEWLRSFSPAASLPCLPDLARLEMSRWQALYAADVPPLDSQQLALALQQPDALLHTVLRLAPSLTLVRSDHPVVALWAAHQQDTAARDAQLASLDMTRAESAIVCRTGDDVLVLPLDSYEAALLADLHRPLPLGAALQDNPCADLSRLLGLLLRYGLVTGLQRTDTEPLKGTRA